METETTDLTELQLIDCDGDKLRVSPDDDLTFVRTPLGGVELTRAQVRALRDYLTACLDATTCGDTCGPVPKCGDALFACDRDPHDDGEHADSAQHATWSDKADEPTSCVGDDPYRWPALDGKSDEPRSVALEAHDAVYGDRQESYGHPRADFTRTAILWTGLLHHKLRDGDCITPEDIGRCQIAVKLARDVHSPKRDNRVDMAGYAITLDRLETGR